MHREHKRPFKEILASADSGSTHCILDYGTFEKLNAKDDLAIYDTSYSLNLATQDTNLAVVGETLALVSVINNNESIDLPFKQRFLVVKHSFCEIFLRSSIGLSPLPIYKIYNKRLYYFY